MEDTIPRYYLNKIKEAKEQKLEILDLSESTKTMVRTIFVEERKKPSTELR